ncbi:MAG: fimbrillin family protein, partial [Dysgonamonadaceae bacterium]|nr:fimbrillin family protein [Dysgonamonadaceae bacterium]
MKKIEKSLSIGSCINYSAQIFILLYGMMLLLTSCDAVELPDDNPAVNEMIQVFINPLEIKEGSSEDLTRASGMLREPETTLAPLGDGLLLEMTLEPVPASPTRATTTLGVGKKFRVIALDSNNKYVSHADFTAGSGSNTDSAFHLPSGKTYTFICVSLNSTTALPATANLSAGHTPSFSAAAGTDLLYGSITRRVDTQNDATLSFVLSHKFSEITVMADCRYNAWSIQTIQANSIRLGSVYAATMSYDGRVSVSGNAVTNRYFSWNSSMTAATTQKSLADVVYTGAANLTLVVSKDAVGKNQGTFPSSETEVTFTGVTLEQGKRYTLNLKIKTPKFAASNIYWNGQALTFDEY